MVDPQQLPFCDLRDGTADHALSLLGNMRFPMFMAIDQGRRTRMKKVMKLGNESAMLA